MGLFDHPWWLVVLAAVGALTLAGGTLSLLTSLGERGRRVTITTAPPVDSEPFIDALAGAINAPVLSGGRAVLLDNGVRIFPEIVRAIEGASRSVNFSVYHWEPGRAHDLVMAALIAAARRGVEVRVMLDGLGGLRTPGEDLDRLRSAGGRVCRFRPARPALIMRFHKRNHRRAIVVDGAIGFTGGAAVADKWLGDARSPAEWRDTMVMLTGPLAAGLQSVFAESWANSCGEILAGPSFYPAGDGDAGDTANRHVHLATAPSSEDHPLRIFYLLTFLAPRRTLYISASYFVPDEAMRRALAERARAGVDVRVLVPGTHTRAKPIRLAGRRHYDELLAAGVRIFEYAPTRIHCKHIVADGVWSVFGSANIDERSKQLNHENVVGLRDPALAEEIARTFLADLERSREITLDAWRRRGLWERVKERVFVLFAEQY